jgi:hypothetical protein
MQVHPMGETQHTLFTLDFNRSIVIEDRPERLTGDAGVLALRQIDHRLGLTDWLAARLTDPRNPGLITHPQVELLRTRLYLIAQGYRDADDGDRLGLDPAFRLAVSQRRGIAALEEPDPQQPDGQPHALASQPTLSRLLATLAAEGNRPVLRRSLLESARRHLHAVRKQAARRGDDHRHLRAGTLDRREIRSRSVLAAMAMPFLECARLITKHWAPVFEGRGKHADP